MLEQQQLESCWGVGILNGALQILARNPAIVIFTLLATGAAYVYDKFQQAEQSTKSFTNQLAELDKLKGLKQYKLMLLL